MLTGFAGNFDEAGITDKEKKVGIDIQELIILTK